MPLLEERPRKVDLHGIWIAAGFNGDDGAERGERHCREAARLESGNVQPLAGEIRSNTDQENCGQDSHRLLAS
jgi:hypothetical protein